jgi:hypothetical protein
MPRSICLAAFLAASLLAGAGRSQAAPLPGPACKANGPCRLPDSVDILLKGGTVKDLVLASNFGLLLPSTEGHGYQFVCEEVFGGRIGDRSKVGPDGKSYVPALDGLYSSADGCAWKRADGALSGMSVYDVAFDPSVPGKLWAVGGDPRVLGVSTDGGQSLTAKLTFPEPLRYIRVVLAPSDPRIIYLAGYKTKVPLVLAVSTDGGDTFTTDENASAGMADANQVVDLLGISPSDPKTVYFVATNENGDEIWKSTAMGKAPVKILTLDAQGQQFGFTFGADAATIFVGSRDPLETVGKPPAWLYVSHNAGETWDKHPSMDNGPRFRCLRWGEGKLYACAGDQNNGDTFLVGSSTDEGKTWTPVVTLADLQGARSCVADKCVATASWLCETYGICGGLNRDGKPPKADAGVPIAPKKKGCTFGGAGRPGGAVALLLAGLAAVRLRRRKPEVK